MTARLTVQQARLLRLVDALLNASSPNPTCTPPPTAPHRATRTCRSGSRPTRSEADARSEGTAVSVCQCILPAVPRPKSGYRLPRSNHDGSGHLYLVQLENRVIKAGRSADPKARTRRHSREAELLGMSTLHTWEGARVPDVAGWEKRLLAVFDSIGTRTVEGSEYFRGIPFAFARYLADHLARSAVQRCCCGRCVQPIEVVSHVRVCQEPVTTEGGGVEVGLMLPFDEVIRAVFDTTDIEEPDAGDLRPGDELIAEFDPALRTQGTGAWRSYLHTPPARLTNRRDAGHSCSVCSAAVSWPSNTEPRPRRSILGRNAARVATGE